MTRPSFFTDEALALLTDICPLPDVVLEASTRGRLAKLLSEAVSGRALVVADENTHTALGSRVADELGLQSFILPGTPYADRETVDALRAQSAQADVLVAVGGGTISDLCKYASFLDGRSYIMFPTAASMNGYTSANASIVFDGEKKTVAAHLPKMVLCDMEVISSAPARLMRAGVGDSLARSTAQADWMLSHHKRGTAYDPRPFALIAPYEPALLQKAAALVVGDKEAYGLLMTVLLLSGLGMTLAGGSYPASQGEHAIAHAYEQLSHAAGEKDNTLHGEAIGVTTLYMARIQESLGYGGVEEIRAIALTSAYIEKLLHALGAPTTPEALGWNAERFGEAVKLAPGLRDRFGFLNLAKA